MDLIVDNPFVPVLSASAVVALVFAAAARLSGSRWAATLAAPVVFLVAYGVTYQKIPPFPPAGAANKIFWVALFATAAAAGLEALGRVPRWALPVLTALLAAGWIGSTKLADPDSTTLILFATLVVAGGLALWGLDRIATLAAPFGGGAQALAGLAAVSGLSAPTLLFGGSSTGVGVCLGLSAGAALLSAENLGARRILGSAAIMGAGGGLLAALDTIALVTRRADPFALALIALAPFLGPWSVRLLPPALQNRPLVAGLVSGLATLSPLPVIVALLFLRHDNPLG